MADEALTADDLRAETAGWWLVLVIGVLSIGVDIRSSLSRVTAWPRWP